MVQAPDRTGAVSVAVPKPGAAAEAHLQGKK